MKLLQGRLTATQVLRFEGTATGGPFGFGAAGGTIVDLNVNGLLVNDHIFVDVTWTSTKGALDGASFIRLVDGGGGATVLFTPGGALVEKRIGNHIATDPWNDNLFQVAICTGAGNMTFKIEGGGTNSNTTFTAQMRIFVLGG